jgi:hypothetical protein
MRAGAENGDSISRFRTPQLSGCGAAFLTSLENDFIMAGFWRAVKRRL